MYKGALKDGSGEKITVPLSTLGKTIFYFLQIHIEAFLFSPADSVFAAFPAAFATVQKPPSKSNPPNSLKPFAALC